MKFKTVMIIKAVVCLGFGPLLLVAPKWLLTFLGTTYCEGTAFTAREYGSALMGTLLLAWLGRNAETSIGRTAIIWNLFFYDLVAFVMTLNFQLRGGFNYLGWGIVFVYFFFAVTFGYFLIPKAKTVR